MTTLKRGARVEWRSMDARNGRPHHFFRGTIIDLPTTGAWLGMALVDDGSGLTPRHVDVSRLVLTKASPRSVSLGGHIA